MKYKGKYLNGSITMQKCIVDYPFRLAGSKYQNIQYSLLGYENSL